MDQCPKCSGKHIDGPHYVRSQYGGESLKYRCARCGYSKHEPCDDAANTIEEMARALGVDNLVN